MSAGAGAEDAPLNLLRSDALTAALFEAQQLGFLGPGSVNTHIAHSLAYAAFTEVPPGRAIDLGSGGGLPGLALALAWPASTWVLLDANHRRTEFLSRMVEALGLMTRVAVRCQRAEEAGREPTLRGSADLVVARSFGPPAVTAECGSPLLRVGGHLVVAEPPGGEAARWPAEPLALLGLRPEALATSPATLQRLVQMLPCPERFPRRTGIPTKRPLYR